MQFVNYFDHIYCINLLRRGDRWEECKNEFTKIGILDKIEKFHAVDGSEILPSGKKRGKNNVNVVGCNYSHLKVVKDAIKQQYKNILILEDDVEFIPDFLNLFDKFSEEIHDRWDFLYLGGNYRAKCKISDHVWQLKRAFTTHAYAVSSNVYNIIESVLEDKIKAYINRKPGFAVIDVELSKLIHDNNLICYGFYPKLAWQRKSYSDLRWAIKDYMVLRK